MKRDAHFYVANLGADVARCINALEKNSNARYEQSLARARKTLRHMRHLDRPEAYEEGLLLVAGLRIAKSDGTVAALKKNYAKIPYKIVT